MRSCSLRFRQSLLLMGISLDIFLVSTQTSPAQTPSVPPPSTAPLDLALLNSKDGSRNDGVITDNTISQRGLTIPSLWWAKQQFGGQLLDNWLAYRGDGNKAGRIDLVVNQQNWNSLDYIQRYAFVNNFGNVARGYGYNVRVFNSQAERLATYTCNFNTNPRLCSIQLDATSNPILGGS